MGFLNRLQWLFFGTGEAPASFKAPVASKKVETSYSRQTVHERDRDQRGGRDYQNQEGGRSRESRDRYSNDSRGSSYPRDRQPRNNGGTRDNFNASDRDRDRDRERGQGGPRRSSPQNRRDSFGESSRFPRPIERPAGGPSSTMMPPPQAAAPISVQKPEPVVQAAKPQGPERVGTVTHYYDQAKVAAIKLDKGILRSGDWIEIQGSISALRQKIDSIQIDNQPVPEAREGQEIGLRVIRSVKSGDAVVKLRG